jgi:probable HAF family extracellular repeat protein
MYSRCHHCLLILALLATSSHAVATYTVIDLGNVPDGSSVFPADINNVGQVVGAVYVSSSDGPSRPHAFLWSEGIMTDLGTLDHQESSARGINDSGQVTGWIYSNLGGGAVYEQMFVYDTTSGMQDLGSALGMLRSQGRAINNAGQIAGWQYPSSISTERPVRVDGSTIYTSTAFNRTSEGRGINELGQVTGYVITSEGNRAFRWTPGTAPEFLDPPEGGTSSSGVGINSLGVVVGNWRDGSFFERIPGFPIPVTRPYLYIDGMGPLDLGGFGGPRGSAFDINEAGQVVGYSSLPEGVDRAFIWTASEGMIDLNTLIPADSEWTLRQATAINELGHIVGVGSNPTGGIRGFLLIPEPALVAPVGLLSLLLTCRPRRG